MVKALWSIILMTLTADTITLACGRKPSLTEKVSLFESKQILKLDSFSSGTTIFRNGNVHMGSYQNGLPQGRGVMK